VINKQILFVTFISFFFFSQIKTKNLDFALLCFTSMYNYKEANGDLFKQAYRKISFDIFTFFDDDIHRQIFQKKNYHYFNFSMLSLLFKNFFSLIFIYDTKMRNSLSNAHTKVNYIEYFSFFFWLRAYVNEVIVEENWLFLTFF